mmetsp:Transcript_128366/g.410441  ORF Transcript_128366/g.410441 Transcript_128366/m.410441 type:complete len:120 (+) Transcript_128366:670-1029(+)
MNTPLHLAVARGFTSGVRQLLSSGANPTLRNLRGDTPVQYFLLPRLGSAASACRAVHSSLAAGAGDPEHVGAAFNEDGGMGILSSSGSLAARKRDPEQIGAVFIEDGGRAIVWSSGSFN